MDMTNSKAIAFALVGLMLASALANVVSAGPATRGTPDNTDSEPNNTIPQATAITLNTVNFPGTLNGADNADVFKIQLSNSGGFADTMTVIADFNTSNGVGIEVTDAQGFMYYQGFDNQADNKVLKFVSGYTQYYYINLTKQFGDASYTLSVNKVNSAYGGNGNNDPSQAQTVTGDNVPINSNLDQTTPKDHQDFFKITLSSSGSASDLLVVFMNQSGGTDFWLQLYKSVGVNAYLLIKQSKGAKAGANVTMSYGAQAPIDLYIRIFAWSGTGPYKVYIQKTSINKDSSNDYSTATPITLTNNHTWAANGEVGEGIDIDDWYSLMATKNQFINVSITSIDYNPTTRLPMIFVSLLRNDHTTDYSDVNQTDSQVDPLGYTNGTTTDNNKLNYIRVYVVGGGGGGRYSLSLVTDRTPVLSGNPVGTINIVENSYNNEINFKTLFSDPDGNDALFYTYVKGDGSAGYKDNANLSVKIGTNGTVNITPKLGNPRGWTGNGALTLRARDPFGLNASYTFTVDVRGANHPPYVKGPYNATMSILPLVLLTYGDAEMNATIDLKRVFADNDTIDTIAFDVFTENPAWASKTYTTVLNKQVVNAAVVNDSVRISFTFEANLVTQKGPINILISNDAKTAKLDHDVTLFFEAYDNGQPVMKSPRVKLQVIVRKPGGNAPDWKTTLTKVQFAEDNTTEVNFDDYIHDTDAADEKAHKYQVTGYGSNITVTQKDRSHYIFGAKANWYGVVNGVNVMATDTFGLTANKTFQVVVTSVPDAPTEDQTKTSPVTSQPVIVDEGKVANFTIGAKDQDSLPAELIYEWKLDGAVIPTAVTASYQYKPNFDSAGKHTLQVKVTDNEVPAYSFIQAWNITVTNINRPPTGIKILSPANNASFKEGAKIDFNAQAATDLDKDTLTYTWYADAAALPGGNVQTFSYSKLKPGQHTISLEVSDNKGATVKDSVTITVKKKPVKGFLPGYEGALLLAALAVVGLALLRKRR
jgi:hypothetical protein